MTEIGPARNRTLTSKRRYYYAICWLGEDGFSQRRQNATKNCKYVTKAGGFSFLRNWLRVKTMPHALVSLLMLNQYKDFRSLELFIELNIGPFCAIRFIDIWFLITLQWRHNERDGVLNHRLVAQPFDQVQIKQNTKHWPLWRESIGDWWTPPTSGQ